MKTHSAKVFMSSEHTLNDTIMMHICCTFVQTHSMCNTTLFIKVNPKRNWGPWWLWCMNTVHPWFKHNKRFHSIDNSYACKGREYIEHFCTFSSICYKSKTALKILKKLTLMVDIFDKTFLHFYIVIQLLLCLTLCNPVDCGVLLNIYTDHIFMCGWWTDIKCIFQSKKFAGHYS